MRARTGVDDSEHGKRDYRVPYRSTTVEGRSKRALLYGQRKDRLVRSCHTQCRSPSLDRCATALVAACLLSAAPASASSLYLGQFSALLDSGFGGLPPTLLEVRYTFKDAPPTRVVGRQAFYELRSINAWLNGVEYPAAPFELKVEDGLRYAPGVRRDAYFVAGIVSGRYDSDFELLAAGLALTGINTEFDGDQLNLVAADGFRLAVHKTTLNSRVKDKSAVIIPAKTLTELSRVVGEQEEPIEITVNEKKSQVPLSAQGC